MGTLKGDARRSAAVGAVALGMSAVVSVQAGLHGTLAQAALGIGVMAVAGTILVANGTLLLPGWARRRRQQMEQIAEWLPAALNDEPKP